MRRYSYLIVDWSARQQPAPSTPSKDAIWFCLRSPGRKPLTEYCRTQVEAEAMIRNLLDTTPGPIIAGFDFPFGYPRWAMEQLGGWEEIWAWLEEQPVEEDRFKVAGHMNEALGGPYFWGAPAHITSVSQTKAAHGRPEYRECESRLKPRPQSAFKLYTAGSAGSQSLLGIPMLERLRHYFGNEIAVWPFEDHNEARIVIAEVWPSLLGKAPEAVIPDQWQVERLSELFEKHGAWLGQPLPEEAGIEGWILSCSRLRNSAS